MLLREPRVEDDLEQQVAELLAQRGTVAVLDGLDDLEDLLHRVRQQRLVRLLRVPRAAAGRAQAVHDRHEVGEGRQGRPLLVRPGGHRPASAEPTSQAGVTSEMNPVVASRWP